MAMFPCSSCGKRYVGKQATLYFAVTDGTAVARQKYRLCPDCREDWAVFAEGSLCAVPGDAFPVECPWCPESCSRSQVFATYYSGDDGRADFWGSPCQHHADLVRIALGNGLCGPWRPSDDDAGPPVTPTGRG